MALFLFDKGRPLIQLLMVVLSYDISLSRYICIYVDMCVCVCVFGGQSRHSVVAARGRTRSAPRAAAAADAADGVCVCVSGVCVCVCLVCVCVCVVLFTKRFRYTLTSGPQTDGVWRPVLWAGPLWALLLAFTCSSIQFGCLEFCFGAVCVPVRPSVRLSAPSSVCLCVGGVGLPVA